MHSWDLICRRAVLNLWLLPLSLPEGWVLLRKYYVQESLSCRQQTHISPDELSVLLLEVAWTLVSSVSYVVQSCHSRWRCHQCSIWRKADLSILCPFVSESMKGRFWARMVPHTIPTIFVELPRMLSSIDQLLIGPSRDTPSVDRAYWISLLLSCR